MSSTETLMVLIPALPLVAALLTAALGKTLLRERSHLPALLATAASFVLSLALLLQIYQEVEKHSEAGGEGASTVGFEHTLDLWTWASVEGTYAAGSAADAPAAKVVETDEVAGAAAAEVSEPRDLRIAITLRADPLTAVMLVTVTFVSMLVVIYSIGYMHGDVGYWRFFSYVSLFVFSMTMLVSASNFVLLYVFWEAVGLCSYLLIGFWFTRPAAAAAGKKAFLVNRVGDFGFALGVFLIWTTYGTLNFHDTGGVAGVLGQTRLMQPELFAGGGAGLAICLLLLVGACGKSAQFPLHVWLPDAMEGPSPVSALIHAATMVTAGVYMIARCAPLFVAAPGSLQVVALVGAGTAVLAAIIALTQTDLKRVLAYSTVSQLGYMFLGLGTGTLAGMTAGMFHLFTHAFFKALLFLGAGSVMHAMGDVVDMRRFGGLRRRLPVTHWTFLMGAFALAGVVPLAGFWSKDAIIAAVGDRAEGLGSELGGQGLYGVLYWVAIATAGLTAFYTFRAYFMTFHGPERIPEEAGHHAHESPRVMTWPLIVLAVGSLVVGWLFNLGGLFVDFLAATPSLAYEPIHHAAAHEASHMTLAIISTVVVLASIGLAAYFYLGAEALLDTLTRTLGPVYRLSYGKFFFDPIYNALVVLPLRGLASACYWFDRRVIDALVDGLGRLPPLLGSLLRGLQNGMVPFYALAMMAGLLVLMFAIVIL